MRTTKSYDNATAEIKAFNKSHSDAEYHVILHATRRSDSFREQLVALMEAAVRVRNSLPCCPVMVMRRFFISDAANQTDIINDTITAYDICATSIIQQQPLDGTKVAMWLYMITGAFVTDEKNNCSNAIHGNYCHIWNTQMTAPGNNSEEQTVKIMSQYADMLARKGLSLADNCLRTWLYVNDIDNNYSGMVRGRNLVFANNRLTNDTHFIASTGISGRHKHHEALVLMDAYAVGGLRKDQIRYLKAADYLNKTSEYGVSFERGTAIDYGDRRHVLISGTASIDNKGNTLYIGDVAKQTQRMIENVCALLAEAHCSLTDMSMMVVYLRDTGDYNLVNHLLTERFSNVPLLIVLAPVCRPGWLIEMECIATCAIKDNRFFDF